MNCIQCGKPTSIGTAYLLPFMVRGANGIPAQLVACSKQCRDDWRAAQREVKKLQAQQAAREGAQP